MPLHLLDHDGIYSRVDGSPHVDDDEFDGDSLSEDWTWVVPTGVTQPDVTVEASALGVDLTGKTGIWTTDFAAILKPITDFAVGSTWQLCHRSAAADQNGWLVALVLSDGVLETSNIVALAYEYTGGEGRWCRYAGTLTATTRNELRTAAVGYQAERIWLRLAAEASNTWRAYGSSNGRRFTNYNLIDSPHTWATTLTPTHAGVGFCWYTGRTPTIDVESFRRIS